MQPPLANDGESYKVMRNRIDAGSARSYVRMSYGEWFPPLTIEADAFLTNGHVITIFQRGKV